MSIAFGSRPAAVMQPKAAESWKASRTVTGVDQHQLGAVFTTVGFNGIVTTSLGR